MTDRWMSTRNRPDPGSELTTPSHQLYAPTQSKADENDALARLAEAETILRATIETISPDAEEIKLNLARRKNNATSTRNHRSSFRLIVAVVILVFLMLTLDLLLT